MLVIRLMLSKILLFSICIFLIKNNVIFAAENVEVCYNYSCYAKQKISVSDDEINYIKNVIFTENNANTNVEIERENIIKAIAFLYKIASKQTPIFRDVAGNYNDPSHGKMDCIDHSNNTFTFLRMLEKYKLLKFHKVGQIETRYFLHLIPSHYAISIQEIADNKIYIIDSWYANIFADELPKIFDITTWKNDDIDLEVY